MAILLAANLARSRSKELTMKLVAAIIGSLAVYSGLWLAVLLLFGLMPSPMMGQ